MLSCSRNFKDVYWCEKRSLLTVCTHALPQRCRNLTSRFLIAMRQQQAAPTAIWAGAGVKGHCGWLAFLTYSCLSAHSASLSHEPLLPLRVVIFRSGCTAGSAGGGGRHLLNCHTRIEFKNRTTALCEEADTSLEYECINGERQACSNVYPCYRKIYDAHIYLFLCFRFAPSL